MLNKFKIKIKNKNEIFALSLLIITTIAFTTYYNFTKQKINNNYKEVINNIYFKKTANHFFDNLEPKFKKIRHLVNVGETFDSILQEYSIDDKEIQNMFVAVTAMLGRVPNSYRTLALAPLVAKMLVPFNATVQREGAGSILTSKLKEMVVIKTSHLNQCNY